MSQVWYYDANDVDVGPVSRTQLRLFLQSRNGGRATLVWCETLDDWQRADEVAALADVFAQAPGPIRSAAPGGYGAPAARLDRRDPAPARPRSSAPPEDGRRRALVIAAWIAAACIGTIAAVIFKGSFLWPAALGGIAWFTLSRCNVESAAVPMLAVLLGHTGWMLVGYVVLATTGRTPSHAVIVDLVIVVALSIWFLAARSRAAVIGVLAYQVLSLGIVLVQAGPRMIAGVSTNDLAMAYILHTALRVIGLALCIYAVVMLRSAQAADERADERAA
jgi:hypothetical protein